MKHFAGLLLLGLAAVSCADGADLCDAVEGEYTSLEAGALVVAPNDDLVPVLEYLVIGPGEFQHQYSDVVEVGEWSCSGSELTALDGRFSADLRMDGAILVVDHDGFLFAKQP